MSITFKKELICKEDIVLSMDSTIDQDRGTLTPFNAAYLPYTASQSVTAGLDDRYTKADTDIRYALVNGSTTNTFLVADATTADEATTKRQLDAVESDLDTSKVEEGTVLRIDIDNPAYNPQYPSSPTTKKYVDDAFEDKFLGAVTGQFIAKDTVSGNDITIQVTNGVVTYIG